MWIHFQNWLQLIVQCASHRDRAGILAVVEVYAHVVLWRFLPFSGPAGWLPKADSYANTMAYLVKSNHENFKVFPFPNQSLCKSWNLAFWNKVRFRYWYKSPNFLNQKYRPIWVLVSVSDLNQNSFEPYKKVTIEGFAGATGWYVLKAAFKTPSSWPKCIYYSHYSNGVSAMFSS